MSKLSLVLRILEIQTAGQIIAKPDDVPVERLCWHCCHPWQGHSIEFPISQDSRLKKFKVVGQFCSWECIKAYNRDNYTNIRNSIQDVNIRYYRKMLTGNVAPVSPAPPRSFLKAFGGKMTIDEFRKNSSRMNASEKSLWSTVLIQIDNKLAPAPDAIRKPAASDENRHVDFADASCKNDSFRLRRPKPLAHGGRNGLERALGLNSLIKIKS